MTEKEYLIESLCYLPKEILEQKLKTQIEPIEHWLNSVDNDLVKHALTIYDNPSYKKIREQRI